MSWPALFGKRRRTRPVAAEDVRLHAYLDESFAAWPFTDAAVETSPATSGVYLLYKDGRLVYIGLAVNGSGIRAELESHRRGAHGPCTQEATAFLFELAADPVAVHRRYLAAHRARYGGRLPPCNERELTAR